MNSVLGITALESLQVLSSVFALLWHKSTRSDEVLFSLWPTTHVCLSPFSPIYLKNGCM